MKESQKVKVWVCIAGCYSAFHEISFTVEYDVTNDKQLGDEPLEYYENHEFEDIHDYELRDAYLINDVYYVKWD